MQEKLLPIGVEDLRRFEIGETTGALYYDKTKLATVTELETVKAKVEALLSHPAILDLIDFCGYGEENPDRPSKNAAAQPSAPDAA